MQFKRFRGMGQRPMSTVDQPVPNAERERSGVTVIAHIKLRASCMHSTAFLALGKQGGA